MSAPQLLYLAHRVPYPPDKGDRIRTYHMLRFLARRWNVHLACLADEPVEDRSVAHLRELCANLAIIPTGRWLRWLRAAAALGLGRSATEGLFSFHALRRTIHDWAARIPFSAALASSSGMAPYLRLAPLKRIPRLVDLMDVDSQKWFDYAAACRGPKRRLYRLEGRRLRSLERELCSWAHALMLVSEAEAALFSQVCGAGPVHAVENGVDLEFFTPALAPSASTCVFIGALDYRPNVDGALWFCHEVWPLVRLARPDSRFTLVGRNPVPAVLSLGAIPGVSVVGRVLDVRPYLAEAAVVVAPLRIARGMQNKVLEALAMAKPTIASAQALEGLRLQPGRDVELASTPESWAASLTALWSDYDRRKRLGEAGRRYVETHHQWSGCLEALNKLLPPATSAAACQQTSQATLTLPVCQATV